jgi:hypothetical protein
MLVVGTANLAGGDGKAAPTLFREEDASAKLEFLIFIASLSDAKAYLDEWPSTADRRG